MAKPIITSLKRLDTAPGEDKQFEITIEYTDGYYKEPKKNDSMYGNRRFNLIVSTFMNTMENLWFDETIKILESEYNLDSIIGDDIWTNQDATYRTLLENMDKKK